MEGLLDRLDALRAFTLVADEGSLAEAGRRLRRSPAAITRAIAGLESELGATLFQRTTRAVRLTDAGARYLPTARLVLASLDEAAQALGERTAGPGRLRGRLSLTTPSEFGRLHVRPALETFLAAEPGVQLRWLLMDRVASLVEEGFDVAIRIGPLPASRLTATRLGEVRRIACASPGYLAANAAPRTPADLARFAIIAFSRAEGEEIWNFPVGTRSSGEGRAGGRRMSAVHLAPRVLVTDANAAVGLAASGHGITRVLSHQAEAALAEGRLVRLLIEHEPPPAPVQFLTPERPPFSPRLRAFADSVVPALRATLGRIEASVSGA